MSVETSPPRFDSLSPRFRRVLTLVCRQVHFGPDGVAAQSAGPEGVTAAARALGGSLDALGAATGAQAAALGAALAQVEAYCADVARLRAQLLEAEQRLRHAAQPNYSPRDPERALRDQQVSPARDPRLRGGRGAREPPPRTRPSVDRTRTDTIGP